MDIFHQYENKDYHGSEGQNSYGSNNGDDLELGYNEVTMAGLAIDERDEQLDANGDVDDINVTFQLSLWTAIQDEVRRKEQDKKRKEDDAKEKWEKHTLALASWREKTQLNIIRRNSDSSLKKTRMTEDGNYICEFEATAEDLDFLKAVMAPIKIMTILPPTSPLWNRT